MGDFADGAQKENQNAVGGQHFAYGSDKDCFTEVVSSDKRRVKQFMFT